MQDIQITNLIEVLSTGRFHKRKFIIKQLIKLSLKIIFSQYFKIIIKYIYLNKFNKN